MDFFPADGARYHTHWFRAIPPVSDLDPVHTRADKQGGGNYQTMINQVLKEYIHQDKSLADILRQVIREELKPAA